MTAQERAFYKYCEAEGLTPGKVYREEGRSARHESIRKRPVFQQLLEEVSQHQFDVLVCHTLDSWGRNLKVLLESVSTLDQHNVGLVSITENIDYSTDQGKLMTIMLAGFAEYFSDSLGTHIKKGIGERALQGPHLGGIPFGYSSCWEGPKGDLHQSCAPEHPGGVHPVPAEAEAVRELFRRYASGLTTLGQLATWLNTQGFRTRNMHRLPDGSGS